MPSSSKIWIGSYDFDLADVQSAHSIQEVAIGPTGPIDFTMHNWAGGMQTADQGIEYRTVEDTQSGYFDETRGYRRATLHSYITSKGVDAAFPGQVICQPQATTVSVGSNAATFGSILKQVDFTPSGGVVNTFVIGNNGNSFRIVNPGTTNQWTLAYSGGTGAKDGIVHGGYIAIGHGSGGQVYSADGTTFTNATANKADAYGALNANLYRAVRPNTVYAATAVNGTWDSGSSIADSSYNINSLNGIEQILMIGKEDGVYSIDSEGLVVPFTPELRTQANANFASVRANESFNGDYYFRTLNGVIEISGGDGTKSRVGLDQLSSPDLPTVVVQGLAHDDRYLYALCANTSNDLMILRRTIGGAWHVFYWDGSAGVKQGQHIAVSSVFGYPALFFSYYDGSSVYTTKFIRLSTFPNALQDTSYRYDASTTGRFRLGRFGSSEAQVVLDQIIIQSRNCAAGVTITPYIAADGGAITQFGSAAVTSSPSTTIVPTSAVTANYIDLYFDLATNSATTTPVLVGFSLKGTYRPNYRRVHTFTFTSKRSHRDIRGGVRREAPTEAISDLHTLLGTNSYLAVKDERGQSFSGMVQGINRQFLPPKPNVEPEEAIQVVVQEAALGLAPAQFTYGSATYS